MNDESALKVNFDLSPADIVKLKYEPVTSSDVERNFVNRNLSSETIEEDSLSSTSRKCF